MPQTWAPPVHPAAQLFHASGSTAGGGVAAAWEFAPDSASAMSGGDACGVEARSAVSLPSVELTPPTTRPDPAGAVSGFNERAGETDAAVSVPCGEEPRPTTRPVPAGPADGGNVRGGAVGAVVLLPVAVGGPTAGRGAAPQLWTAHPRGGPKISRSGPARE